MWSVRLPLANCGPMPQGIGMNKALAAFYLNGGIREIIPIYPLYAIMFGEHGVSPFFLSVLFVIWCLTCVVVEVPSDALADRFSRKWLIVASGLFKSAAFLCWYFVPRFEGFALGFILWGIGSSLRSGAWEALLHDLLKARGREHLFARHYGAMGAVATTGVMFGEIAGGLLIVKGYDTVLLVSACVPLVASAFFVFWVQDVPHHAGERKMRYLQLLKEGVGEAAGNPVIRYMFLVSLCVLVSHYVYDEYVEPYVFETGFSLSAVAFVAAGIVLAAALGEWLAGRFTFLTLRGLLTIMLAANLLLLVAYFATTWAVPVLIGIYCLMFGIVRIQFAARLQTHIKGAARATVTSTLGLGGDMGAIAWFLAFGAMAETSMATASAGMAAICIGFVVVLMAGARWLGVGREVR